MARQSAEHRRRPSFELEMLVFRVREARVVVAERRAGGDRASLLAARGVLRLALETYAHELTAHGLPISGPLRDELRLQRHLQDVQETARRPGTQRRA